MRIRTLVLAGAVMVSGGMQMRAQMSGPPPSPPVGTKEDPAKAVDGCPLGSIAYPFSRKSGFSGHVFPKKGESFRL